MPPSRPPKQEDLPSDDELFRSLIGQSATGVVVSAVETGRLLRVNDAMCRMTGYSERELLQLSVRDITHPDDVEPSDHLLRRLRAGEIDTHTQGLPRHWQGRDRTVKSNFELNDTAVG